MNTSLTPESILQQIAQIHRMDRGVVSVIRQGPKGPYFNHQCYEQGRNVSRYVPAHQVPELQRDLEAYHLFEQLVEQYAQLIVEQTRAARATGFKKKSPRQTSSLPKTKKSNK
jgi:hypothetical protein